MPTAKPTPAAPQIKVYSTDWCGFCKAEKRFLADHHLAFDDINVEADPQAADEMVKRSGQAGVPVTVITRPDGSSTTILGYDRPQLMRVLGLK